MEKKVIRFMKENQLLRKHTKVLVAVSGGPDSLALLYFLHRHRSLFAIDVMALTLDHQLRGDVSREDALFVQRVCEQLSIPCIVRTLDVRAYQEEHREGTQLAARQLRYAAYEEVMEQHQADYLALGHHGDDQVETVLMAMAKTTTIAPLAGIPVQRDFGGGKLIRPFLSVTKAEIEQFCEQHQLTPRIDLSNLETAYTRNYMRRKVVPLLEMHHPNLAGTIHQLTETVGEDEQYLFRLAEEAFGRMVQLGESPLSVTIPQEKFLDCPVPLQRRIFRLTLDYLYGTRPKQITYKQEEAFLHLASKTGNKKMDLPGDGRIEKTYDVIYCYVGVNIQETIAYEKQLTDYPATVMLPEGAIVTVEQTDTQGVKLWKQDRNTYICSARDVVFPLTVRTRKPGDRMTYEGLAGTKKIKDIFIDEKIDPQLRDRWPIVADATGKIIWLIGLKKSPSEACGPEDYPLLLTYDPKGRQN